MYSAYDENNKQWGTLDVDRFIKSEESYGQKLLDVLAKHGSKVAQINDGTGVQMTFHEVRMMTIRAAQNLLKRGYEPHQIFSFMADNSDYLLPIFLATICLACPIIPLNTSLSKDEIIDILSKTKPVVVFCDAKTCAQMREALNKLKWNLKIFTFGGTVDGFEPVESLLNETGEENKFMPISIDMENDIAGIFPSSGTTGPSKCVCISYDHTVYSSPRIHKGVVLCLVSIYWTVGIKAITDCIFGGTTRIISTKSSTPQYFMDIIQKYKVSVLMVSPFRTVSCLKARSSDEVDLSSVKKIYYYGNQMPFSLVAGVQRIFPNAEAFTTYGLTEIGGISLHSLDVTKGYSGDRLFNGCLAKIIDGHGDRHAPNVNGEICIKLNYKFRGYFDNKSATLAVVDDEGFFRTGDIGHFDEKGALFIEGRIKNIMQVFHFGGFILPTEIEEYIISLPEIKEACVVGIPLLNLNGPVLPAAVIVRKTNSNINQRDIFDLVADKFPNRAKLRGGVYFIDSLPKTFNGKLVRARITEIAIERFNVARECDSDIQSYLSEYPEDNRKLI